MLDVPKLYICDQTKECAGSPRCGTDCKRTTMKGYAKIRGLKDDERRWEPVFDANRNIVAMFEKI